MGQAIELNDTTLGDDWRRWTGQGLEMSFLAAFPDVAPPSLARLSAGVVREGVFYPRGSVAKHYFDRQREVDAKDSAATQDVYFIRSVKGGPVKIGVAKCIVTRLATLQTAHPYDLEVIAKIPAGGRSVEGELHQRFAAYRLNGEWFEWCDEIEDFVNNIRQDAMEVSQ